MIASARASAAIDSDSTAATRHTAAAADRRIHARCLRITVRMPKMTAIVATTTGHSVVRSLVVCCRGDLINGIGSGGSTEPLPAAVPARKTTSRVARTTDRAARMRHRSRAGGAAVVVDHGRERPFALRFIYTAAKRHATAGKRDPRWT